jgi:hypothetical protein
MKLKIAITDSRISAEAERGLALRGYRVMTLPPFSRLSEAVASHPDMLISRIGNDLVSYADYCEEASYVFSDLSLLTRGSGVRFTFTADEVSPDYPSDVGLNGLVMGNKLFIRTASASESLLTLAREKGLEPIDVKQGYPACTVLKLNDEAAITSDRGMAAILEKHGIRVTLISAGDVSLPPYDYGFIGGAGEVDGAKLFLLGDPSTHRDCRKILDAASAEGLTVIPLSSGALRDLGGILFIEVDDPIL